uniref:HXXXD-type acyl-transferase family protein n=1 Tax=Cannabis sativa TaxID=3483 RepID=A0A803PEQ3_CANSA
MEATTTRFELTQPDLTLIPLHYIQKGLLFPKPSQPFTQWIQRLETAFFKALDIFYPLAGRLVMTQNDDVQLTKSFFIDCNGAGGAFFDHVTFHDVTVADILDPLYIPDDVVYSFFPLNFVCNFQGVSKPLLAAQVTELVDGVFIGLSANHCVADGTMFWLFFNTWSQICRQNSVVLDPPHPVFDRDQFFEAVMAHLWVSITRNRSYLKSEDEVNYIVMVGLRQRMEPPLSEAYCGNAVMFGNVETTAGKLLGKNGLGWAALKMNKMVVSHTPKKAQEYLKNWAESPDEIKMKKELGCELLTGSSPRFNVYGNDFGWGRPVTVRSGPGNKYDGKLTVFPGSEHGSIDFEVCLRAQTLESMSVDKQFMETVTI